MRQLAQAEEALERLPSGQPVVVLGDDVARPAALVFAAVGVSPDVVAFVVRHAAGFRRVALPIDACARLGLSQLARGCRPRAGEDQRVAVDAADGVTTGISATDRAQTIRVFGDPYAGRRAPTRPGHMVPIAVNPDDPSRRPNLAARALAPVTAAGMPSAAGYCELVSERRPFDLADGIDGAAFGHGHGLPVVRPSWGAGLRVRDLVPAHRVAG